MTIPSAPTPLAIDHLADRGRFQAVVDGDVCELDYHLDASVMTITHTGVPRRLEGRGIAAALVRAALEHARASGWKVRPLCAYARVYMLRHAETQTLLA